MDFSILERSSAIRNSGSTNETAFFYCCLSMVGCSFSFELYPVRGPKISRKRTCSGGRIVRRRFQRVFRNTDRETMSLSASHLKP